MEGEWWVLTALTGEKFFLTWNLGCVKKTENLEGLKWVSFIFSTLTVGITFIGIFMPKSTHCVWLIIKK